MWAPALVLARVKVRVVLLLLVQEAMVLELSLGLERVLEPKQLVVLVQEQGRLESVLAEGAAKECLVPPSVQRLQESSERVMKEEQRTEAGLPSRRFHDSVYIRNTERLEQNHRSFRLHLRVQCRTTDRQRRMSGQRNE